MAIWYVWIDDNNECETCTKLKWEQNSDLKHFLDKKKVPIIIETRIHTVVHLSIWLAWFWTIYITHYTLYAFSHVFTMHTHRHARMLAIHCVHECELFVSVECLDQIFVIPHLGSTSKDHLKIPTKLFDSFSYVSTSLNRQQQSNLIYLFFWLDFAIWQNIFRISLPLSRTHTHTPAHNTFHIFYSNIRDMKEIWGASHSQIEASFIRIVVRVFFSFFLSWIHVLLCMRLQLLLQLDDWPQKWNRTKAK